MIGTMLLFWLPTFAATLAVNVCFWGRKPGALVIGLSFFEASAMVVFAGLMAKYF